MYGRVVMKVFVREYRKESLLCGVHIRLMPSDYKEMRANVKKKFISRVERLLSRT